jgi:RNA polymerase sigma-70 factor (ECF subfamily)
MDSPAQSDAAPAMPDAGTTDLAARREGKLVRSALDGDGKAIAELVKPHLPLLYRVAARACGDASLAEDAVQETLDVAYQKLAQYEPGTSLRAFLAAIAVQRAKTLARGERRRRTREDASAAPESVASPAEWLGAKDLGERVLAALEQLPDKRRQAVLLRLDGGLSHAEIANELGSTERSVRVLVHLALKELRAVLADVLGDRASHPEMPEQGARSMS